MRRKWLCYVLGAVGNFHSPAAVSAGEESEGKQLNESGVALFNEQIEPALVKYCFECHSRGAEEIERWIGTRLALGYGAGR